MGKQKSLFILDEAMQALGIDINMKTEPKVIRSILKEMKLDNFKTQYKPLKLFLDQISNNSYPIKPMFLNIKQGILNKHPAVLEFIEEALKKKLVFKIKTCSENNPCNFYF